MTFTVHLVVLPGVVEVQLPSPSDTGIKVDYFADVFPGQSWADWSYEELRAMGSGQHELETKGNKQTG